MRIQGTDKQGRLAIPVKKTNRLSGVTGFMCNPTGPGNHKPEFAKYFSNIDETVTFLKGRPSWGVWLKAGNDQAGLYFNFLIDGMNR